MISPSADEQKITVAAEYIRTVLETAGREKLGVAFKIGGYVFKEFFGSNPLAFTDRSSKSPSLRALLKHPSVAELGLSHRTLSDYVKVVIQKKRFDGLVARDKLPKDVDRLGFTKRVKLLPTKRTGDLIRIIREALTENLSSDEIEELVKLANKPQANRPRQPDAKMVRLAKKIVGLARDLYGEDEKLLDDVALMTAEGTVRIGLKVAGWSLDLITAEVSSRPSIKTPSSFTDNLAADSPAELNALLTGLCGEDLGLDDVVRRDTDKVIRFHGKRILADLKWANPASAREWLAHFCAEAADVLGLEHDAKPPGRGPRPGRNNNSTNGGSRPHRTWYRVAAHDKFPAPPFTFGNFIDGAYAPPLTLKCVLKAADERDAVDIFRHTARGRDADVDATGRVLIAEKLVDVLRRSGSKIASYLASPLGERLPTVEEYAAQQEQPEVKGL